MAGGFGWTGKRRIFIVDEAVSPPSDEQIRRLCQRAFGRDIGVDRQVAPPRIVEVLDAELAWWGDPLADWIIFLLATRQGEPEWQASVTAFCEGYGALTPDRAAEKRLTLYNAMHLSLVAAWYAWRGDGEAVKRTLAVLDVVATKLLKNVELKST